MYNKYRKKINVTFATSLVDIINLHIYTALMHAFTF